MQARREHQLNNKPHHLDSPAILDHDGNVYTSAKHRKTMLKQIRSFFMAKSYDRAMRATEKRCLQRWRHELLQHATGEVLEIGAGTGINLPHYPVTVSRLVLSEPDRQMRLKLDKRLSQHDGHKIDVTTWDADNIAAEDHSFDTIVSTLVLCSVPDQLAALAELHRLLRPGGKLIFIEHVLSDHPPTQQWQHRLEPVWSLCAGDCKLTRNTAAAIEATGFSIEQLTDAPMVGTPAFVSRTVRGIATKLSTTAA
jgi:ubiquinone/menaquinone biosynthesis C-methylase UbiE